MTDPMSVWLTDCLVSDLAERRPIDGADPVIAALAALNAEIDAATLPPVVPRVYLSASASTAGTSASVSAARRAGLAVTAVSLVVFGSSGLAAAVAGDPMLPLRYVAGKIFEHGLSEPQPTDRLLGGGSDARKDLTSEHDSGASEPDPVGVDSSFAVPQHGDERARQGGPAGATTPASGRGAAAAGTDPAPRTRSQETGQHGGESAPTSESVDGVEVDLVGPPAAELAASEDEPAGDVGTSPPADAEPEDSTSSPEIEDESDQSDAGHQAASHPGQGSGPSGQGTPGGGPSDGSSQGTPGDDLRGLGGQGTQAGDGGVGPKGGSDQQATLDAAADEPTADEVNRGSGRGRD